MVVGDEKGSPQIRTQDDTSDIPDALDNRITRKLDTHIIPWLFGLWLLAFIDRSNIGNARIEGMGKDLYLDAYNFNVSLAIYYIPKILMDVPSNLVMNHLKAGYYLPGLLISWGLVSMCTGFIKSYAGLLAVRFFLGLCEGGLLGGMLVYLAMFYRRQQLVSRIVLFYCAAPLSGAFGGLLASGLAQIQTDGYKGWPFIFFVEGAISVLFGILILFFLPHTPLDIPFLTASEKSALLSLMRADAHGATTSTTINEEKLSWYWVRRALLNVNTILLSLNFFAIITPIYSFSLFLPTIIKNLGFASAQLLTVPPNMCAFVTVLLTGYFADRFQSRGPFMLAGCTLAIIGYVMQIASREPLTQYGGTFLVAAGIFPCSPVVLGWLTNNLAPHYVRATGTGVQVMVANMAAFVATFAYLGEDAPRFTTGHSINIGMLSFSLLLTTANMLYCTWENGKRESGARDVRLQQEDEAMLGYRHPKFRYTV